MTDSPFPFKDSKHSHKKKFQRSGSCDSFYMSSHEERLAAQKKIEEFSSTDEGKSHAIESELSGSSVVRVDIEDICNLSGSQSCVNVTTFSLKKCKSRILVPYSRLLKLIGWRPLGRDIYGNGNSCGWKAFNTLYVILVLLFVVYGYIYDIMSCQWKLDLKYDVKYVPVATASPYTLAPSRNSSTGANLTTQKINILIVNGSAVRVYDSTTAHSSDLSPSTATCGHIVTTYIIPDLLHFAAYILGLWYFRIGNNENLYALMEKVFLQTANMQTRAISQSTLIARMRSFFIFGFIWVVSSMFLQGLFVYTFGLQRESILTQLYGSQTIASSVWPWILFVIDLIGVAVANCINLAVVLNYSIQCEMLRYYVNTVGTRLKERSTDLKSAMQNVLGIRESISLLNSDIARMTSLAVIRFGEMFIIGLCLLILNENNFWRVWLYRSVFPFIWAVILFFPLIQAASLNAACSKFKTVALSIRVYGYQNEEDSHLDSFLLFIANTTLRSKLFHIPVKPSYLLGATIVTCFTLLLLFQTSSVGSAARIF